MGYVTGSRRIDTAHAVIAGVTCDCAIRRHPLGVGGLLAGSGVTMQHWMVSSPSQSPGNGVWSGCAAHAATTMHRPGAPLAEHSPAASLVASPASVTPASVGASVSEAASALTSQPIASEASPP